MNWRKFCGLFDKLGLEIRETEEEVQKLRGKLKRMYLAKELVFSLHS